MRSLAPRHIHAVPRLTRISCIALLLAVLCGTARAGGPRGSSAVGPYVSWSLTGWFPQDKLASFMKHADNGARFALIVGARLGKHVALEAFMAPPLNSDQPTIDVRGVDVKVMWPIGRYVTPYARLRVARMTVDFETIAGHAPDLRGLGGGEGIGLQVQFPGRMFGLIIPAWFAAPFGFRGVGGIWTEATHEAYDLAPRDGSRAATEHFWRYAYGVAWGMAF